MKIVFTAIAIFFSLGSIAQQFQYPWDQEPLKGNVKQIRTSTHSFARKKELEDRAKREGKRLDTVWFLTEDSSPDPYKIILYNDFEELWTKRLDTTWQVIEDFEKSGYRAGGRRIENGTCVFSMRFENRYNVKGDIVEQRKIGEKNEGFIERLLTYDTNGRIVQQAFLDDSGQLSRCIKYTYASRLLVKEQDSLTWSSTTIEYKYNNGKLIEEINCCAGDSQMSRTTYTYDDKGNMISKTWFTGKTSIQSDFDRHGNIVGYGGRMFFQYSYDEYGNWIRRIEKTYEGNPWEEPIEIYKLTIREIEYY